MSALELHWTSLLNNFILEINECDPNPCENGASCDDLLNDYQCSCLPGYTGTNCQTGWNIVMIFL